jgi:hypothetical protein
MGEIKSKTNESDNFLVGSLVKLKGDFAELYNRACVGSRGIVRFAKTDRDGFPMVFIEWDKDDWRYNGQDDNWTFASHFDLVKAPAKEIKPRGIKIDERQLDSQIGEYIQEIENAFEEVGDSEGFMVLSVHRMRNPEDPGTIKFVPHIHAAFMTEEAHASLSVFLAETLLNNYYDYIESRLNQK